MDPLFPTLIKQMQSNRIPVIGFTALETGIYGKMNCIEDWRLNRLKTLDMDFSPTFSEIAFILTEANPYKLVLVTFIQGWGNFGFNIWWIKKYGYRILKLENNIVPIKALQPYVYGKVNLNFLGKTSLSTLLCIQSGA